MQLLPERPEARFRALAGRALRVAAWGVVLWGAGCASDDESEGPTTPTVVEQQPPPEVESYEARVAGLPVEWSEREKVEALLLSYCGDCHASDFVCDEEDVCAGMEYVDDMAELTRQGQVLPGDPAGSPLVQRMADGSMPPGAFPQAPAELIERVAAFVENLCPSELPECAADADTPE